MAKEIKVGSLKQVSPADSLLNTVQSKKPITKAGNRRTKETNSTAQRSSQHVTKDKHRTILIKSKTDDYLKTLATIYGTSVNELVNKALDNYVSKQLQDEDISSKIKLLQEITIKK